MGYVFAPFAWLMGIPWHDCVEAGSLLGQKTILNEFVAYMNLSKELSTLEPRTVTILTYALCGFSNLGSIAIQIGGIGGMAPNRRGDLAKLGLRALLGGTLACFMTAAVAGMLL
jgi:CNT family concentrative nucleoside transporter